MTSSHQLTPSDVMDLRTSIRSHPTVWDRPADPFMLLNTLGQWELHAFGQFWAVSRDPHIIVSVIEREKVQPGFIRDLFNPLTDCEKVLLPPAERSAYSARVEEMNARLKAQAEQAREAAWRARRVQQFDPALVNLSDLD